MSETTQTHQESQPRLQADRREVLKATGAAIAFVVVGRSGIERATASDDDDAPTLTTDATTPGDTAIQARVYEYTDDDGGELVNSDSIEIDDGTNDYDLAGIEGSEDYYYDFEIELGSNDNEVSPEFVEAILEIPLDPNDFEHRSQSTDEWSEVPENAEIVYDEYRLRKYQPRISMDSDTRRGSDGMFAFVADSDDEDTFVCCYWLDLPKAETAWVDFNSQLGSHKPIYVFVDEETEEIEEIVYSGYQYLAADVQPDEDDLEQSRGDEPTHASFEVIDPWNHLSFKDDGRGSFPELHALEETRSTWTDHGWYDAADAIAVEDPWQMRNREMWWDDSWTSFSARYVNIARRLGAAGGEHADELRVGSADGWFSFDFDFDLSWPWSDDEDDDTESNGE
ncbi:hypothetical protein [Natronorubrum texcoconense]|uniref:Uncharacterized protein n=1 Tax=Natronorubrum texcoconense TaxID=1095776 RepID=A0A1G9H7C7_9EURY|nr:hypothetical protein [Natronorubrum texcoconense]SDL08797.1 hypothetical protein SAMN04515672_0131 [Natronorubrum texcoconense]